jgi:hypothetical protein
LVASLQESAKAEALREYGNEARSLLERKGSFFARFKKYVKGSKDEEEVKDQKQGLGQSSSAGSEQASIADLDPAFFYKSMTLNDTKFKKY